MTAKDGMALGAMLVGAVLAAKGKPVIGAPVLIGAGLFLLRRYKPRPRATPAPPQHRIDDLAQARALLGVGPDADPAAIRAAHRRLIASSIPTRVAPKRWRHRSTPRATCCWPTGKRDEPLFRPDAAARL